MCCRNVQIQTVPVLQVLVQAEQHVAVPFNIVTDILTLSLRHDADVQDSTLSSVSSDLLTRWKEHFRVKWREQLGVESAASLATLFLRDRQWSDAALVFQSQAASSQVCFNQ